MTQQVLRTLLINRKTQFVVQAREKIDGPFITLVKACMDVFFFEKSFSQGREVNSFYQISMLTFDRVTCCMLLF